MWFLHAGHGNLKMGWYLGGRSGQVWILGGRREGGREDDGWAAVAGRTIMDT